MFPCLFGFWRLWHSLSPDLFLLSSHFPTFFNSFPASPFIRTLVITCKSLGVTINPFQDLAPLSISPFCLIGGHISGVGHGSFVRGFYSAYHQCHLAKNVFSFRIRLNLFRKYYMQHDSVKWKSRWNGFPLCLIWKYQNWLTKDHKSKTTIFSLEAYQKAPGLDAVQLRCSLVTLWQKDNTQITHISQAANGMSSTCFSNNETWYAKYLDGKKETNFLTRHTKKSQEKY